MIKKRRGIKILSTLIVLILIIAIYLTFVYTPTCKDIACWESKLVKCSKAKYINDPRDITWSYTIKGKVDDRCEVNVKALEIKRGLTSTMALQGKDMDCFLPFGVITEPEQNPNICNGILKEKMQTLIIEKLHQYIVANIGLIGQELTGIEGVTGNSSTSLIRVNSTAGNKTNSSG